DLDVGLQGRPPRLQPREGGADSALDLGRKGEPAGARSKAVVEPLLVLPQQRGARIAEPEDAMANPHEPLSGGEFRLSPHSDIAARGGFVEHVEGRAGRAAMQWSGEGAIGAERGRDERG